MTVYELIGDSTEFQPDEEVTAHIVGQYVEVRDEDGKSTYVAYIELDSDSINLVRRNGKPVLEIEL